MKTKSDAGKPLRASGGREVIEVETNKGYRPFSVKRRNIANKKLGSRKSQ